MRVCARVRVCVCVCKQPLAREPLPQRSVARLLPLLLVPNVHPSPRKRRCGVPPVHPLCPAPLQHPLPPVQVHLTGLLVRAVSPPLPRTWSLRRQPLLLRRVWSPSPHQIRYGSPRAKARVQLVSVETGGRPGSRGSRGGPRGVNVGGSKSNSSKPHHALRHQHPPPPLPPPLPPLPSRLLVLPKTLLRVLPHHSLLRSTRWRSLMFASAAMVCARFLQRRKQALIENCIKSKDQARR